MTDIEAGEIESVARAIGSGAVTNSWEGRLNHARRVIEAYNATPHRQAERAVVEAAKRWYKNNHPMQDSEALLAALERLADLEKRDG